MVAESGPRPQGDLGLPRRRQPAGTGRSDGNGGGRRRPRDVRAGGWLGRRPPRWCADFHPHTPRPRRSEAMAARQLPERRHERDDSSQGGGGRQERHGPGRRNRAPRDCRRRPQRARAPCHPGALRPGAPSVRGPCGRADRAGAHPRTRGGGRRHPHALPRPALNRPRPVGILAARCLQSDAAEPIRSLRDRKRQQERPLNRPHPNTVCVEAGSNNPTAGDPVSEALHLSTTYRHGGDYEYIREASPTIEAFERAVGALEAGQAVAFSSGMAASAAVLDGPAPGSRVVAPTVGYKGVRRLLADRDTVGALDVSYVDQTDTATAIDAIGDAKLVWAESPNNPLIGITDLRALADAAHERGARLAVDATLATPLLQRSLELGADFVVHSATKYIAGHSDSLLGVVVCVDEDGARALTARRAMTGAVPGPFETFLGLRGIRTLALRVER